MKTARIFVLAVLAFFLIPQLSLAQTSGSSPDKLYTVQAASFKKFWRAKNLAQLLRAEGKASALMRLKGKGDHLWYVVRSGTFDQREEAVAEAMALEKLLGDKTLVRHWSTSLLARRTIPTELELAADYEITREVVRTVEAKTPAKPQIQTAKSEPAETPASAVTPKSLMGKSPEMIAATLPKSILDRVGYVGTPDVKDDFPAEAPSASKGLVARDPVAVAATLSPSALALAEGKYPYIAPIVGAGPVTDSTPQASPEEPLAQAPVAPAKATATPEPEPKALAEAKTAPQDEAAPGQIQAAREKLEQSGVEVAIRTQDEAAVDPAKNSRALPPAKKASYAKKGRFYAVQVASIRDPKLAGSMVRRLAGNGFDAYAISMYGWNVVFCGEYPSYGQAVDTAKDLKRIIQNPTLIRELSKDFVDTHKERLKLEEARAFTPGPIQTAPKKAAALQKPSRPIKVEVFQEVRQAGDHMRALSSRSIPSQLVHKDGGSWYVVSGGQGSMDFEAAFALVEARAVN